MDYEKYTGCENNIACHYVEYTHNNKEEYGEKISNCVTLLGRCVFKDVQDFHQINYHPTQSIGYVCFMNCTSLKLVDFLCSTDFMMQQCFAYCALITSIKLPTSLKII